MIQSLTTRAALPVLLLAAAPLAAQDRLPVAAADNVEVQLTVHGAAEVSAQGYRVAAFLNQRPHRSPAGSGAADRASLISQLEAREISERETCLPTYPWGFEGNEFVFAADQASDSEDTADAETSVADAPDMIPQSYSGLFGSRDAAEEARRLLQQHAGFPVHIQPVLFDCTAALESATLAALRKSQAEIAPIAEALRMRNAGVTRIENAAGDQAVLVFNAMRSAQSSVTSDTVEVPASLKVTFRLDR